MMKMKMTETTTPRNSRWLLSMEGAAMVIALTILVIVSAITGTLVWIIGRLL
jgi:hypothetical protein